MSRKIIKILSLVILLIVFSCSFKDPVLPSWFMQFNIPLSEETYKLQRLISDSDSTVVGGQDSLLFISIEDSLEPTGISREHLSVEPQQRTESIMLDTLELDSLKVIDTDTIKIADLLDLTPFIGNTFTVPDTIIDMPDILGLKSDDYRRLHVLEGLIRLRIKNTLPFPIGPNIGFTVKNDTVNNEQIAQVTIPDTIFPGQQGEGSDQIGNNGINIYSPLGLEYRLQIAKETSFLVTQELLDTSGFRIELILENIRADEATVKLGKQHFNNKVSITYEDENRLRTAEIDSGTIQLHFTNYLPVGSNIIYTIPDIRTESQPLTGSLTLPPAQDIEVGIDLENLRIENEENPGEFIDTITVDITGTTLATDQFITISSSDSFSVDAQTSKIIFDSFEGFFALDTLEVSGFSEDNIAEYGDFGQGVFFQDAELSLNLMSGLLMENLTFDLNVTGYHTNVNGVTTDSALLSVSQTVSSNGSPEIPDNILISVSGQEVADFLNILPTAIKVSGTVMIEGEAAISQNSEIRGNYNFSTPFQLEIIGLDPIQGDVTTFIGENDNQLYPGLTDTLTQDVVDFGDNFERGELELQVVNHTPMKVKIRMLVSSDLSRPDSAFFDAPINDSLEFIDSTIVLPGQINSQSGYVTTPTTNTVSLDLTREDVRRLTSPPYKVGYELKVFDSNGIIALRTTDFVKAIGLAKIVVKVEDK